MHRIVSVATAYLPFAFYLAFTLTVELQAAPQPTHRKEARELEAALTKAGNVYKEGKFQEAGEIVRDVQTRLDKLTNEGGNEVASLVDSVYTRLGRAHALLELEGIELPALKKPAAPMSEPAPGSGSSFVKDVVPILLAKCGRCHVGDNKGEFSMASYTLLMRGALAGVVVFPGDPQGSRLIEVIESGDMPRGGQKVSPSELAILKKWIQSGAKFDGKEPSTPLANLAGNLRPTTSTKTTPRPASGKETVSFSRDIAAIFSGNCSGCHVDSMRVRGGLNMTSYRLLMRGGDSGSPVTPGKPADSLLLQKLLGKAGGERMPLGRSPLPDDLITKIETWIKEGASFDGGDSNASVTEIAAEAQANSFSHDELSAARRKLALDNWQLGLPGVEKGTVETENFLVLGNFGEATLAEYAKVAESVVPQVKGQLKVSSNEPLMKGRMTLFFLNDRYSYNEFGKMVEKRDVPKEYRGHWRYTVVDAYGALIPPKSDEYALNGVVAHQLIATHIASLGRSPRWFTEGAGRALAARVASDDPRIQSWDLELPSIVTSMGRSDDFMTGKLPPESADIASYSFARFLLKDAKKFDAVLRALRDRQEFEVAFAKAYGAPPARLTANWIQQGVRGQKGRASKGQRDKGT